VTGPAVPLPTDLTAAAWASVAAEPVTAFSAFSWAAVPCAGPLNAGRADDDGGAAEFDDDVVVDDDVAALAIAPPPTRVAPTAAAVTSFDLMFLMECPSGSWIG
jgi:hypothetical protein